MKLPVSPAPSTPQTVRELRRRAQRAREIAALLIGDPAEERLLSLARDYDEQAAQLERAASGSC